ncbi:hypothetical protein K466DRAFT_94755 [Polyporus arcularius HHB13444]|uniref:F-box domain-containing protein n=1 Tax=Polyporus arcularius HHB13444 TaxID=1314778 RepID=A0A5C3PF38_9APHY|nr:hypothetical protein K466DRAFT_94755 [Polyporus arcularius HHB13444]
MDHAASPPLPLELFLLVIDAVGEDPDDSVADIYKTLRACALTCSAWLARARMQLYAYVFLERRDHYTRFARTIYASTELAQLVQEMRCDLHGQTNPELGWAWHIAMLNHGKIETPLPNYVVARLTNLTKLSFEADARVPVPVPLVCFMRSFGICEKLTSLTLHSCLFITFDLLAGTVWSFPHVKTMKITQNAWYDSQIPPPDEALYPGKCESVTKFQLFLPVRVDPLLELMGPTVSHLSLWSMRYDEEPETYQAVSRYTALNRLTLTFENSETSWLLLVLENVRARNLEGLWIDYISRDQSKDDVVALFHDIRLDDILSRPPFRHLSELTIFVHSTASDEDGAWLKCLEAQFPQCVERGILEASIEEWKEEFWPNWLRYD